MEDAVSNGICYGRPFGGVSIAWSPNLNHVIRPLSNFRHKRVVAIETKENTENFLFICVYMPFYDSSKREECITDTMDAITMIETIIEAHPLHTVIIGGDFNTELKSESPFDPYWDEIIVKYNLICCDKFVLGTGNYTYNHESLGQKKWNDHFLVSESAISGKRTSDHVILDEGQNPSDHHVLKFNQWIYKIGK